ncbi:MAG: hypothetical protein HKN04_15500, partial [Rhodothermaceae bacterium]|nr:hypothetical protein [Rhodothermaceae bacterium]
MLTTATLQRHLIALCLTPLFLLAAPQAFAQADSDGDGVTNTLELNGYQFNINTGVFDACVPVVDAPCYVTDPLSWSSDGDPYSDGQEASGVNMDATVARPYNSPLVSAYPVIEVALNQYTFTSNATITDSNGQLISQSESFTASVEATASYSVTAGAEASFPGGVSASTETTASFSATVGFSGSTTSGQELNWETATSTELNNAGTLSLSLFARNSGGATALDVRPTFNIYIGDDLMATVLPDEPFRQSLAPGEESAPVVPIVNSEPLALTLTFDRLKALQTGAPVTIEVVDIEANIQRWRPEDSNWECGTGETCSWTSFQNQILPRTLRLLVDFGYSGDPDAEIPFEFRDNPFEFRVYTGSPNSNPEFTLRDVLRIVEYDLEETGGGLTIEGRAYPTNWMLTAQADEDGYSPILEAWEDAGEPDDLLDLVMPTQATLLMASPDPLDPGPFISAAVFTRDMLGIRVAAYPRGSFPIIAAEAHIVQYGIEHVVPLAPSPDGTYWTTEGTDNDPFLIPAGAQSSYVVFTDRTGASRQSEEMIGLPILPVATCDQVPMNDRLTDPTGLAGFDATLFVGGDLDTPVEVFCGDNDGTLTPYHWVPKESGAGSNGLYGATFVDERTAVVVGNETVLRSTDGGRSWTDIEVTGLSETLYDVARRPDTGTLVAVGGGDVAVMLRSTDDGQTWAFGTPTFGGTTLAVGYAGNDTWYAVGENGVKISTDDGQTWADDPNQPAISGSFVSVAFRDAMTGMLLDAGTGTGGTGNSWRTTDGGQTWTDVIGATGATDVTYAGNDTWYVTQDLGDVERVLRSRQNGVSGSWELLD